MGDTSAAMRTIRGCRERRAPKCRHPNRVAPDIEQRILDFSLHQPTRGPQYLANQLLLDNVNVSAGGVRGVWLRHDIETRHKRLMRLERHARQQTFVLSEAQIKLLERHSSDFRSRHVEASRPGELLNQDTFYWGTLKGVGKVYVQVIVDVSCSFAFAKVYTSKMPITACDLLHDRVLPFYEHLGITVGSVLTDNGREFCGKPESHPYELLLAVEGIKHRTTKVRSPRTNGFVERMNRTLLDECFRVQGRTKWYEGPDQIQRDLDTFMAFYNFRRTHQGYRVQGRTPAKALYDLIAEQWLLPPMPDAAQEVPLAS
jgi:transposase InsO family protein